MGKLICDRLESIRLNKGWEVGALHASPKIRWKAILNNDDVVDVLIKNLNGLGLYPGNDAKLGEQVWIWSEHMVWWYDARVTKLHEEETGILKKVIITSNDSRKMEKRQARNCGWKTAG